MSVLTKGIFIVGAKRTAFGALGGAFKNTTATQLQTTAAKAAISSAGLTPDQIDTVNIGHVMPINSSDGIFLPRHVSLQCGIPMDRPALGLNRLCGSGFQSVVNGVNDILVGAAKVSLTGGVDNMSQTPYCVRNIRFGTALGTNPILEDAFWISLNDTYCNLSIGLTGENLAVKYNVTKAQADEYALRSQHMWKKGQDEGAFKAEIEAFKLNIKGKELDFQIDENPRPDTTLEELTNLMSSFKKNGTISAGSTAAICDGAAAVIVASEEACKEYNLKPLARLVAYSIVGVAPEIMGIGPVSAIETTLKLAGWKLDDLDLIEINETFATQALACANALKLDINKLNVNGGAIAMGYPLAASGSRITAHLAHELQRKKLKRAVGSACIGGGQGIALLLESV